MVRSNAAQVYGFVTTVRVLVGALCAMIAAAIILIALLILRREGRELMAVEQAIGRLGDLNLPANSADRELEVFDSRSDEIGMIAQTTHRVCGALRETINDMNRILGQMAGGNFTVGVEENQHLYIGDFSTLSERLNSIRSNLTDIIRDITQVAGQVDASADQVSSDAQTGIKTIEDIAALQANILTLNAAVQANSSAAERSAAVSKELSGQARALNGLIGRFHIS